MEEIIANFKKLLDRIKSIPMGNIIQLQEAKRLIAAELSHVESNFESTQGHRFKERINAINIQEDSWDVSIRSITELLNSIIEYLTDEYKRFLILLEKHFSATLEQVQAGLSLSKEGVVFAKELQTTQDSIKEMGLELNRKEIEIKQKSEEIFEVSNLIQNLRHKEQEAKLANEALNKENKEIKQQLEIGKKTIAFGSQAERNKHAAEYWLKAFIVLSSLLILLCIIYFLWSSNNNGFLENVKQIQETDKKGDESLIRTAFVFEYIKFFTTRALMLYAAIYVLMLCIKNYNSHMHNFVINNHKANALSATINLLDTAKSESGNDSLLLQATQTIFSHQRTGYGGKEGEMFNPSIINGIIDTIKSKAEK